MSGKIIILDEFTANQIAAGEVVERPASVLKELIENSIDAKADRIDIEIKNGGIGYIKVSDNGNGIDKDDIPMAFERHGTSKIRQISDIYNISTMGFRGEALPSIASVSNVSITTKTKEQDFAVKAVYEALEQKSISKSARAQGTTIEVKNLFFNTPARYKFLKGDKQEARYCTDIVLRLALANTHVAFSMISNGQEVIRTNGDNLLLNCIYGIYGRDIAKDIIEINAKTDDFTVSGYIGRPFASRGNRQHQSLFINNRYVKYPELNASIERAYETRIMKGRFPFYVLKLNIPSQNVDVNVHPSKIEVKISNISEIFGKLNYILKESLDKEQKAMEPSVIRPSYTKYKEQEDSKTVSDFNNQLSAFSKEIQENRNNKEEENTLKESIINYQNYIKEESINKQDVITCENNDIKAKTDIKANITNQHHAIIDEAYRIAGQILNTYIIIDKHDYIYVIDQHAAHEKIYFEQLKEEYEDRSIVSQQLMIPIELVITSSEMQFIEDHEDIIKLFGFDFTQFGKNSILIREIPTTLAECNIEDAFRTMIDDMVNDKKDKIYTALYTIACKAAVKANKKLDEEQMKYIYEKLMTLKNPFTCPHGRPTIIKMNRYDFDKLFKRIV
ncbi:MAG: DNA mismatch repair endonuclease MutL [Clostridia bacterium]|nr:DNA mismatch repair endonuclease MutL [Clostridia bacterium]MDD4542593.1 DNA mismatch repair endonuclease MutL [Clostridia bacterium]